MTQRTREREINTRHKAACTSPSRLLPYKTHTHTRTHTNIYTHTHTQTLTEGEREREERERKRKRKREPVNLFAVGFPSARCSWPYWATAISDRSRSISRPISTTTRTRATSPPPWPPFPCVPPSRSLRSLFSLRYSSSLRGSPWLILRWSSV